MAPRASGAPAGGPISGPGPRGLKGPRPQGPQLEVRLGVQAPAGTLSRKKKSSRLFFFWNPIADFGDFGAPGVLEAPGASGAPAGGPIRGPGPQSPKGPRPQGPLLEVRIGVWPPGAPSPEKKSRVDFFFF